MPGASMENSGRLAGGFALLVVLWIVVYWWWEPSEPPIRFQPVQGEAEILTPTDPTSPAGSGAGGERSGVRPADASPAGGVKTDQNTTRASGTEPGPVGKAGSVRAVVAPEFVEYTIQAGDTFEKIARKQLGSATKAGIIARANPFVDPSRLKPGRVIRIPRDPENISGKPVEVAAPAKAEGTKTYKVESGDTLSDISQRFYGESKYADLIFQANRDRMASKNALKVGQELVIPPKPEAQAKPDR